MNKPIDLNFSHSPPFSLLDYHCGYCDKIILRDTQCICMTVDCDSSWVHIDCFIEMFEKMKCELISKNLLKRKGFTFR